MEAWGFIWIMLVLKIPLVMLLYIVWWAIKQTPEPVENDQGDGGTGDREPPPPERPRWPRQRGPHGEPVVPPPARTRTAALSRDRAER